MPAKLTYEYVLEFIKSKGCELISREYTNTKELLDIRCNKCNEVYKQRFEKFWRDYRHPRCKHTEYKKQTILTK